MDTITVIATALVVGIVMLFISIAIDLYRGGNKDGR